MSPYRADTGEILYDKDKKLMLIQAPKAAGVVGFPGPGRKVTAGAVDVELASRTRGFATILLTSLDERPLKKSGRMLLSIPGYALATQPGADPPRPQRLVNYRMEPYWWTLEPEPGSAKPAGNRNGGIPPVWMERVECYLTLRSSETGLKVFPLDGAGGRLKPLGSDAVKRVEGGFRIHLQADGQAMSPWYEIAR